MIMAFSLFFYFFLLCLFSLVSHPVYYCVLLVANSLLCSFTCYTLYGFSWYPLLFCLVYIGGVYTLFVFVSVYSPNSSVVSYWSFNSSALVFSLFFCVCCGLFVFYLSLSAEFSSYLCSLSEGYFYICMCLTLLFGFLVLSLVMSVKVNHYR
uniref:NADH dehydrogenase subunit 6 n=1 Tax=Anindobothrium lisae TaxID=2034267 RepID=A0A8K1SXU0_9CEST|nr:NADH dehydrogenase subunit 6 [Anindobothrium lisae]